MKSKNLATPQGNAKLGGYGEMVKFSVSLQTAFEQCGGQAVHSRCQRLWAAELDFSEPGAALARNATLKARA